VKVIFATPSLNGPTPHLIGALEQSIPLIQAAGWDEGLIEERGNPYISGARSIMLRKALDADADVIVFLDYDLSWAPRDLLTLIETPGDVVAGTYRFKKAEHEYMGALIGERPVVRDDGAISADRVPAGFLKVTREAVGRFARAYPNLLYGDAMHPSLDLFNHGAMDGIWYGEDYAFSKRWVDIGGELWIVPNLEITHHAGDHAFPGNFHEFLLRQPGGSKEGEPWLSTPSPI
jgi:glycosyltransferase involved in cell wall biosynthesis